MRLTASRRGRVLSTLNLTFGTVYLVHLACDNCASVVLTSVATVRSPIYQSFDRKRTVEDQTEVLGS